MKGLKNRTLSATLIVVVMLLLSCRESDARIRWRTTSEAASNERLLETNDSLDLDLTVVSDGDNATDTISVNVTTSDNETSTSDNETSTCAAVNIDGFKSCSDYCKDSTGSPLNTFIVLDGPAKSSATGKSPVKQYCCACFSGDAYCSDDIPECIDYVNLDFGGVSTNWNTSKEKDKPKGSVDISSSVSCIETNVTDTLACIDFCEQETGETSHEFGSNVDTDEYYCVCSSTIIGGGTATYCSDNVSQNWEEALASSTVLPVGARLAHIP